MKNILSFIIMFLPFYAQAQNDTSYVYFSQTESFEVSMQSPKPNNDPDTRTFFPFDGGKTYQYKNEAWYTTNSIRFYFFSWHFIDNAPWPYFEYKKVPVDILEQKDFKDSEWFAEHTFSDILDVFAGSEKVIYLIDETEIEGDSTYMVRVKLRFDAME